MKGFLGTWASFSADLNLLIEIAMGIALFAGGYLARAKRYAAHGLLLGFGTYYVWYAVPQVH
jgi:hypothetical protein